MPANSGIEPFDLQAARYTLLGPPGALHQRGLDQPNGDVVKLPGGRREPISGQ
jgi:hypothetical protein